MDLGFIQTKENIILGKTVKAMYKLSGKTLTQLADETGLTVDTLNNLFYARLQKPGFAGVTAIVKATGYTVADLTGFMELAKTFPEGTDYTEEFTKYIFTVKETNSFVNPAENCEKAVADAKSGTNCSCCTRIKEMDESHEKQLDRFRATHLHYTEQLNAQYKEHITKLEQLNVLMTITTVVVAVAAVIIVLIIR